jgi:transposase
MRRFGLRDDQWERIKNLLPGREGSVGVTAADNRRFVGAVLYRYRTGMPWRDLPERFGEGTKIAACPAWPRIATARDHLVLTRYTVPSSSNARACVEPLLPCTKSSRPLAA